MALKEIVYQNHTLSMSYELCNMEAQKSILFLHGWGSSKEAMKNSFSKSFASYKHIYVDLPGFGNSSIADVLDTNDYAHIVRIFLKRIECQPSVIFGHSFGGKVATLLDPTKLVLLSSAGIVIPKSFKIKTKIWFYKLFKPFFPKNFYKFFAAKDVEGMSPIMYEIFKKVVDEDFSDIFARREGKTYLFWGKDDRATPLSSGEKIHSLIHNSQLFVMEGDHFFFLKAGKRIETLLEKNGF
ncbi:MAG: alpha/beta hydrolase [Sulfurospirillaceae bacterium]|nr:alpha/beta hydrolase [Sulfurospirillaceae bacterium]